MKKVLIALSLSLICSWPSVESFGSKSPGPLLHRYLQRLGLQESDLDTGPTRRNLFMLTEAHLRNIPFDNLRMHGAAYTPLSLNTEIMAEHILDRRRGGCCYELNGLFAQLLCELGYDVTPVPALVYMMEGSQQKHMGILVKDNSNMQTYYVDVGMGEPPLCPVLFQVGLEQKTAEGMQSRFISEGSDIFLQRYDPSNDFWYSKAKLLSVSFLDSNYSVTDFESDLLDVFDRDSIFRRKLVACRLTRDEKITLAGHSLKRTLNRLSPNEKVHVQDLRTKEDVRAVLESEFGIPLSETLSIKTGTTLQNKNCAVDSLYH